MKSSLKIVWKIKITFLWSETLLFFLEQKDISFLGTYFLKIAKNLITSAFFYFFFAKAGTKNHRYVSAKASDAALVKLTDWVIKNDHVINCAIFFWKCFQRSIVIWLSTTWLLIFRLEVANKKPLFTTNLSSIWIQISC